MVAISESVALVTGAASGVGAAMAREFAGRDADVAVVDVDRDGAEDVAGGIANDDGSAMAVEADVADRAEVEAAVDHVVAEFGTIDALCNNAGVFDGDVPIGEMSDGTASPG